MKRFALAALIAALAGPAHATSYGTPDFLNLSLNGVNATGFGTSVGQIFPPMGNYQGSGYPYVLLNSRLIWTRASAADSDYTDMQLNRTATFTGGSGINSALRVLTTQGANTSDQEWNIVGSCYTTATSGAAVCLGGDFQGVRLAGGTAAIWGGIMDSIDQTDSASAVSGKGQIGAEIDLETNKLDTGSNANSVGGTGLRKIIQAVGIQYNTGDATATEISNVLWASSNGTGVYFDSVIGLMANQQIRNGLDTRGAITPTGSSNPVSAVTMTAGHVIDFNGPTTLTGAPRNYFAYDSVNSKLKYYVNGTAVMSVDASGNARFLGTVTGSVTP